MTETRGRRIVLCTKHSPYANGALGVAAIFSLIYKPQSKNKKSVTTNNKSETSRSNLGLCFFFAFFFFLMWICGCKDCLIESLLRMKNNIGNK